MRMVAFWVLNLWMCVVVTAEERKVLSIGSPIIDSIYHVDEALLNKLMLERGDSKQYDQETFAQFSQVMTSFKAKHIPGGSAANTIKGLGKLGNPAGFIGKTGVGVYADLFEDSLHKHGVKPLLTFSEKPISQVISLVIPGGYRTMIAYYGASGEFTASEINQEWFDENTHVHFEGYLMWREKELMQLMQWAKERHATISIDLASYSLVRHFRSELLSILELFVDVVFANEDEARELTGLPPYEACKYMQTLCPIAVVLGGPEGCWVGQRGEVAQFLPPKVEIVDTTGAGDLFASGFLHGYLRGWPIERMARLANRTGSACITHDGAMISEEEWEKIKREFCELLERK